MIIAGSFPKRKKIPLRLYMARRLSSEPVVIADDNEEEQEKDEKRKM